MPRIHVQLQVDFDDDPDVAKLARYRKPGEARALRDLLVAMWRYCKREKSDGHVPAEIVGKLVYPDPPRIAERDAARLVECGLAEPTETGFYLPGYLKHNKSRAQIEAESAAKAEAGKKGGLASGQVRKAEAEVKQPASPIRSHRSENREQRTDVELKKGGERRETSAPAAVAKPPTEPTCQAHPDGDTGDACAGCARVREHRDRLEQQARDQATKARQHCPDCGGTGWAEDENGQPIRKCDHPRTRRLASARGGTP